MRTAEGGFTLVEVVVCVGILALGAAATAGAFAALAREAAPSAARDAALSVAENAIARARAAVAYAPAGVPVTGRTWALNAGTTQSTAGAAFVAPTPCGSASPRVLRLPVATTYDPSSERFSVVVTYPRDPCALDADGGIPPDDAASVTLSATLPPSASAPGTPVYRDIATPARM